MTRFGPAGLPTSSRPSSEWKMAESEAGVENPLNESAAALDEKLRKLRFPALPQSIPEEGNGELTPGKCFPRPNSQEFRSQKFFETNVSFVTRESDVKTNGVGTARAPLAATGSLKMPSTAEKRSRFNFGLLFRPWKWRKRKKSEKFEAASRCKFHFF